MSNRTHRTQGETNVQELMSRNAMAYPAQYAEVMPYIRAFAATHDQPKSDLDIAELLCRIYGQNFEEGSGTSPERQEEIRCIRSQIVDQLNTREAVIRRNALERLKLIDKKGTPISAEELGKTEMNPSHSFVTYLGRDTSPERAREIQEEAWHLLRHYRDSFDHYTSHIKTLQSAGNFPSFRSKLLLDTAISNARLRVAAAASANPKRASRRTYLHLSRHRKAQYGPVSVHRATSCDLRFQGISGR